MSNLDSKPEQPQARPIAQRGSRHLWLWIGGLALVLVIAAFAVVNGVARWMLAAFGILLVLDLLSGVHLLTEAVFYRILLPLVITIAVIPFSLIWPGDPGVSHWSTVRARFQSLGRMWLGYWDLDRGQS